MSWLASSAAAASILAARFREHVGLPPSGIGRVGRFRRAVDLLSASRLPIAEVGAECGYYDQAHLDRDFREFAATTPTAYAAELYTRLHPSKTSP